MSSVNFKRITSTPSNFKIIGQFSKNFLPQTFAVFDHSENGLYVVLRGKDDERVRTRRDDSKIRIRKQNFGNLTRIVPSPADTTAPAEHVLNENLAHMIEIWKYNLSAQTWTSLKLPKMLMKNMVLLENFDRDRILIVFRTVRDSLVFSLFNVRSEILKKIYSTKSFHPSFDASMCKDGHKIFMANYGDRSSVVLHSLDLILSTCQEVAVLPNVQSAPKLLPCDGKILVFYNPHYSWDLDARKVYCYDMASCQWSTVATNPEDALPSDFVRYNVIKNENSIYHFGGYGSHSESPQTEMWNFHVPTLSWTKLPIELPFSKLIFFSHLSDDGRMILCFETGVYQISTHCNPNPLQKMCWELISNYPRLCPLHSYTDGELKYFGISNNFIKKLRW